VAESEATPLIGVIVPVKDPHPAFLNEALESILVQTVPRWRLAIVAEPDELSRIEAQLRHLTADPRVRLLANEGRGHAGAVNTAMRAADTEFVALLLGDDLWHPDAIAVLEDHITRYSNADFFHSARRIVNDRGEPISGVHPPRPAVTLADFRAGTPVKHLLCWRRRLGLRVGGLDERIQIGPDDFDFPWTMSERGAVFCPINECLYIYRDHRAARRLTIDVPLSIQIREMRLVMRKHGMSRREVNHRLEEARRTHLRQARYRSPLHRQLCRWLGSEPPAWRDSYR